MVYGWMNESGQEKGEKFTTLVAPEKGVIFRPIFLIEQNDFSCFD
jgi:hypothetical protein